MSYRFCRMMNMIIVFVVLNSLKFIYCDLVKLCIMYRFVMLSIVKNSVYVRFSLFYMGDGSVSCLFIIFLIRFLLNV